MLEWVDQQCRNEHHVTAKDEQLRKALGDLMHLIRFPVMERTYFTKKVSTKNLLIADETLAIYQSFNGMVIDTFPANMRLPISKQKVWRCETSFNIDCPWGHNGLDDCLDFTTNIDCYIFGINVFGSMQYSGQHDVNINISDGSTICCHFKIFKYFSTQ